MSAIQSFNVILKEEKWKYTFVCKLSISQQGHSARQVPHSFHCGPILLA